MTHRQIAILIDGAYFLHRLPNLVAEKYCNSPEAIVQCIRYMCRKHVMALRHLSQAERHTWLDHVYRIFFYDAEPYAGKSHHPILNQPIDYTKTTLAKERQALFELLRKQRKVALRLGKVNKDGDWALNNDLTKTALKTIQWSTALDTLDDLQPATDGHIQTLPLLPAQVAELKKLRAFWKSLTPASISLGLKQKGVDMRIGVDIASISLKKQASTILLVAGDSDFVPAAKLARREGMEFVLDPMWQKVNADLHEHIDGLQSGLKRPSPRIARSTLPADHSVDANKMPSQPTP